MSSLFISLHSGDKSYVERFEVLWSMLLGDFFTMLVFYAIAAVLLVFVNKRKDIHFNFVFKAVAVFGICCGTVYLIDILSINYALHWLSAVLKIVTAIVSVVVVISLIKIFPKALKIPAPEQLSKVNANLTAEIERRKEVETKLLESKHRFDLAVQGSSAGIWDWADVNEDAHWWSTKLFELLGYKHGEINPSINNLKILAHPEDLTNMSETLINHLKQKSPFKVECRLKDKTGYYKWFLISGQAEWDGRGTPSRMVGSIIDINLSKEAEQLIMESEKKFRGIFENSAVGIALTNNDGKIEKANDAFSKMLGYTSENLSSMTFPQFTFPDDAAKDNELYQKLVDNTIDTYRLEKRYIAESGAIIWGDRSVSAIRDKNGKMLYSLSIIKDISKRKEIEEKLQKLNTELEKRVAERTTQLEEANKELESFSYSVSHDLRAPLRAISSFAEFLEEDYHELFDEEGKDMLEVIKANTSQMNRLIDNLLEFSRLGRRKLKYKEFNMKELFSEVMEELQQAYDLEKYSFKMDELSVVSGDRNLLKMVVTNVLSNAIKYSGKREKPLIEIGSFIENESRIYFVRDNGAGFDMKYIDKLFGVFTRLHDEDEFEGTGVGMAHSYRIIQKHGGRLWAEGKVNKGACFYFTLATHNFINNQN